MNAFVYLDLTTTEHLNEIQFRAERKLGTYLIVGWPAAWGAILVICSLVMLAEEYPPDWSVGLGIGSGIALLAYPILLMLGRKNTVTTLSVTSQNLAAAGRGVGSSSPWGSGTATVRVSEIDWIGYLPSDVPGLYVSRSLMDSKCLLPGLSRSQAHRVLETIANRFPDLRPKIDPNRESPPQLAPFHTSPVVLSPPVVPAPVSASYVPPAVPAASWTPSGAVEAPAPRPMSATGWVELTSKETPDELIFRIDRQAGWLTFAILLLIALGFLIGCLTIDVLWLCVVFSLTSFGFALWMAIMLVRSRNRIETTTLSVTRHGFTATGAGLKGFSQSATLSTPASAVTSFGYSTGDEDEPQGLFVSSGMWNRKCLLPGVNREQGTGIAVAIARKFPEIASKRR